MWAVEGRDTPEKPGCGLQHIWKSQFYQSLQTFQVKFHSIIYSLLFSALDDDIKLQIFEAFFTNIYSIIDDISGTPQDSNADLIQEAVKQYLCEEYEGVGYKLSIRPPVVYENGRMTIRQGVFNQEKVVIKVILPTKSEDIVCSRRYACVGEEELEGSMKERMALWNEVKILSKLHHKNILRLLTKPDKRYIPLHCIYEQIEGGPLSKYLQMSRNYHTPVSQSALFFIALQVCEGVGYLAEQGIIHRDLCTSNILYEIHRTSGDMVCKVASFNLACTEKEAAGHQGENNCKILLRHSAPESVIKHIWSLHSDRWMLGAVIYEIINLGCPPFPDCVDAIDIHTMVRHI